MSAVLRVLDFTRVLAGPYATRLLADAGAEVIKVQSGKTDGAVNDRAYFAAWNRNKKSITLDLSQPEAKGVLLELVQKCDVVAENFAPRVFDNWGLDYETLQAARPGIILLRMSAAGQTGPWRNTVALGPTIHALSGLTHFTSYRGEAPTGPGFAHADVVAGLYGALAILAAVYRRARTGKGQCIDLSMYEAAVSLLGPALLATSRGNDEESLGDEVSEPVSAAPYGFFRCLGEDRWCAIAVFDEVQWGALCDVLAMNETVPRGEFSGVISRRRHQAELRTLIETRTSVREALELAQALQKKGVPAAVVQNAENLARDPHLLERGFWTRLTRPSLGECFGDRGAIRSAGEQEDEWQPAPSLGQDNDAVFRDLLGWPPEKIARLREQGVIA